MESDTGPERSDPVTGDVSREHWTVPVHALTDVDPDGTMQAIARRDGTVSLHMTCGDSRTTGWLEVCRATQLCTGIWEAAGASQQLTGYLGDDHPPTPLRRSSPMPRRRLNPVSHAAARDADDTIGRRIRRSRKARDKSLRVIAGLAGMNKTTLNRIEHGQRDVTLSEIVALANALGIAPSKLIILPSPAPTSGHTHAATRVVPPASRETG